MEIAGCVRAYWEAERRAEVGWREGEGHPLRRLIGDFVEGIE